MAIQDANKEVLSITIKGAKTTYQLIKSIIKVIREHEQRKINKVNLKQAKNNIKTGLTKAEHLVKNNKDFQMREFTDINKNLVDKIAKKYNLQVSIKQNAENNTHQVLVAGSSLAKAEQYFNELLKENEKYLKQKEKVHWYNKNKNKDKERSDFTDKTKETTKENMKDNFENVKEDFENVREDFEK